MAQTQSSEATRITHYSVALLAQAQRHRSFTNKLIGPAPKQGNAQKKLAAQGGKKDSIQSSPEYPIIEVKDLQNSEGDEVTIDLFHTINGKPIMGDRMAEGMGQKLTSSTMGIKIDLTTQTVDAGGKMSQKRTKHRLRGIALANLGGWFGRHKDQLSMVHLSGARGMQSGRDWVIPYEDDPDFSEIVVNAIKAPTFNRHFISGASNLINGGKALESIQSTDILSLDRIDDLSALMAEEETRLQPIKIMDDPAAEDEPLYVLYVSHYSWNMLQQSTGTNNWRSFLQNAYNRGSWGSKHPLFKGDAGMWGNILVKRMQRNIRFAAGDPYRYVAQADRYSAAETTTQIAASLPANYTVDRCLLLGGQALAHVYGEAKNDGQSTGSHSGFYERRYNWKRAREYMGEMMNGTSKIRFEYMDENGKREPTDHGVLVLDVASKKVATVAA